MLYTWSYLILYTNYTYKIKFLIFLTCKLILKLHIILKKKNKLRGLSFSDIKNYYKVIEIKLGDIATGIDK